MKCECECECVMCLVVSYEFIILNVLNLSSNDIVECDCESVICLVMMYESSTIK